MKFWQRRIFSTKISKECDCPHRITLPKPQNESRREQKPIQNKSTDEKTPARLSLTSNTARKGEMNMTSKLRLHRPSADICKNRKRLDKYGRMSMLCFLCSLVLMIQCIISSYHKIKRSIKSTTYKFNAVCVK